VFYSPSRLFFLQSFLLFSPKIRGEGLGPPGLSPRSATGGVICICDYEGEEEEKRNSTETLTRPASGILRKKPVEEEAPEGLE